MMTTVKFRRIKIIKKVTCVKKKNQDFEQRNYDEILKSMGLFGRYGYVPRENFIEKNLKRKEMDRKRKRKIMREQAEVRLELLLGETRKERDEWRSKCKKRKRCEQEERNDSVEVKKEIETEDKPIEPEEANVSDSSISSTTSSKFNLKILKINKEYKSLLNNELKSTSEEENNDDPSHYLDPRDKEIIEDSTKHHTIREITHYNSDADVNVHIKFTDRDFVEDWKMYQKRLMAEKKNNEKRPIMTGPIEIIGSDNSYARDNRQRNMMLPPTQWAVLPDLETKEKPKETNWEFFNEIVEEKGLSSEWTQLEVADDTKPSQWVCLPEKSSEEFYREMPIRKNDGPTLCEKIPSWAVQPDNNDDDHSDDSSIDSDPDEIPVLKDNQELDIDAITYLAPQIAENAWSIVDNLSKQIKKVKSQNKNFVEIFDDDATSKLYQPEKYRRLNHKYDYDYIFGSKRKQKEDESKLKKFVCSNIDRNDANTFMMIYENEKFERKLSNYIADRFLERNSENFSGKLKIKEKSNDTDNDRLDRQNCLNIKNMTEFCDLKFYFYVYSGNTACRRKLKYKYVNSKILNLASPKNKFFKYFNPNKHKGLLFPKSLTKLSKFYPEALKSILYYLHGFKNELSINTDKESNTYKNTLEYWIKAYQIGIYLGVEEVERHFYLLIRDSLGRKYFNKDEIIEQVKLFDSIEFINYDENVSEF